MFYKDKGRPSIGSDIPLLAIVNSNITTPEIGIIGFQSDF
jgi:hypothetical protein